MGRESDAAAAKASLEQIVGRMQLAQRSTAERESASRAARVRLAEALGFEPPVISLSNPSAPAAHCSVNPHGTIYRVGSMIPMGG